MVVVDTNILLYAADHSSPFHDRCRDWLEKRRASPAAWYVTWPIVYEFMRVSTHPRIPRLRLKAASAWEFLSALLASPGLGILTPTERHAEIVAELLADMPHLAGNIYHDVHTVVLMREHGIRQICTRDADFHQFSFLDVIDPLR